MSINKISVSSELGTLRRLIVHSPDAGIGKVVPRKSEDWLYDDIVDIQKMREEYNDYLKVLLWVLDPEKIKGKNTNEHDFFKPGKKDDYFNSDKVVDVERLLIRILEKEHIKQQLVTHICALEHCSFKIMNDLLTKYDAETLARILITGTISENEDTTFLFPPVPNLIFTRDIGIIVNNHLLLTKPAEIARQREAIITKYIAYYELFKNDDGASVDEGKFSDKVIELNEDFSILLDEEEGDTSKGRTTVEGGDVMMVAPNHLLIGCSVRTSPRGVEKVVHQLFKRKVLNKVSVVRIPEKRDFMHIDTVFTQVKRNMWVVFDKFAGSGESETGVHVADEISKTRQTEEASKVEVTQFVRLDSNAKKGYKIMVNRDIPSLEALLHHVCEEDYGCPPNEVDIIYCAGGRFPYNEREQWTDACNLLALKEGVVIGYDRNPETLKEFIKRDFATIRAKDFIQAMEAGANSDEILSKDTFILLPSSELSRARGGSHCMSFPILRDVLAPIQ